MRKILSLTLAIVLCLCLCACNTDAGVTTDGNETTVANVVSEEEMQSAFEDYALVLTLTNTKCDTVSALVYQIWSEQGAEDFQTFFDAILTVGSDEFVSNADQYDQDLWYWAAAEALYPDEYGNYLTSEQKNKVREECVTFAGMYNSLLESDGLKDYVAEFVQVYGEEYPAQAELLREWSIDTGLYIDFCTSPSGTLATYVSQRSEFMEKFNRYQAEADMFS